nr:glutathione S-transferase GSTs7 [Agrotis ipsilon]
MAKYVFYYFDLKGLGESCRLLLAYGDQEYEDRRVSREDWPDFKPKTPFGQMPVLEVNGKLYAQSHAICSYLGRKYGLAGDTLEDGLEIDQNVDLINDLRGKMTEIAYEQDPAAKETKFANYSKTVFPDFLGKLNAVIEKNNGYLALGKLTWGDFYLAGLLDGIKTMVRDQEFDKKYPAIQKVVDNVYSVPKVKAYSESRK